MIFFKYSFSLRYEELWAFSRVRYRWSTRLD